MLMPQSRPDGEKESGLRALESDKAGLECSLMSTYRGSSGRLSLVLDDEPEKRLERAEPIGSGNPCLAWFAAHFGKGLAIVEGQLEFCRRMVSYA